MEGFVYILKCKDGSYYTGSTIDLARRIQEHNNGTGANYTRKRLPVQLVYLEQYPHISDAFFREKQIQTWTRVKKEALINGNEKALPALATAYRDRKMLDGYLTSSNS